MLLHGKKISVSGNKCTFYYHDGWNTIGNPRSVFIMMSGDSPWAISFLMANREQRTASYISAIRNHKDGICMEATGRT